MINRAVPIVAVVFCLVLSGRTLAQSDRGTITGAVSDPSSAVLPGVSIVATNTQTGTKYETISTETGNYTLVQLPAGVYELAVELPGFKKYIQQGITVQVAQTLRVDVTLQVGANTEEVTVTADATLLRTESGEVSHIIPAARLNELPILGIGGAATTQGLRIYLSQTKLLPGAYYPDGGLTVRINGAPQNTQSVRIEGQDSTNQLIPFSSASLQPSVDAVQETAIQTSNYAAEYGQAGGGLYNITMRSGTNQYHGGGFDYLANEAFNASFPYVNTKPRVRRNDYGFNFGGPATIPGLYKGRDKTFFFANFEQYREFFVTNNQPITVPTLAYRQGDFRQALTGRQLGTDPLGRPIMEGTIYDPNTTRAAPDGRIIRDPFPNNVIPANRIDKVALTIQQLIPAPTTGALTGNYTPAFPNDRVTTNWSIKGDEYLSPRAKLSGYFGTNKTAAQYSQQLNGSEGLPLPITATRGTFTVSYTSRANFDYTISPTRLLHLGAGYTQYNFNDNSPVLDYDSEKSLGLKGATVLGDQGGRFPTINGLCSSGMSPQCTGTGGMASMGPGNAIQSKSYMINPAGNIALTLIKSNHSYKFGGEFRDYIFITKNLRYTNGLYTFSGEQTALPYLNQTGIGGGTIGFPYASFLLGLVQQGNAAVPSDAQVGKNQWAFYAQDTWKVTRKFTLDYGLRWDYSTYLREQYGRLPTLSPTLPNPTAGGQPGAVIFEGSGPGRCNCKFARNYPYGFGPRLGLAYQITEKTVFRGGFGTVYTGTASGSGVAANASGDNPFFGPAFGEAAMRLQDGIPAGLVQPWPNFNPGLFPPPNNPTGLGGPPVVIDRNAGRPARQFMWSAGLQREIFPNLAVEVAYVGNRGAWWPNNNLVNYNALTPEMLTARGLSLSSAADRALLISRLDSTAAAARGFNRPPYPGFPLSQTVAQSLRPFPQFRDGLAPLFAPLGRTWYDSLQAKVTKRLSRGLDFSYAFTWQKELTMGADTDTGGGTINDVFERSKNKHISQYSRPLTSILAVNYRLPRWEANRVVSEVFRDWTIGSVLQYASGLPMRVPFAQNTPNINSYLFRTYPANPVGFTGTFANRVPDQLLFLKDLNCHCVDPRTDLVLNPAAWTNPADGQFSTTAIYLNDYRFQRRPQESVSVGRTFRFAEGKALSVRMEFSNIFNRTEMPDPVNTNFAATRTTNQATGALTGGFGFINPATISTSPVLPRQGTLVVRFTF